MFRTSAFRRCLILCLLAHLGPLHAAVIDDPAAGGESFFAWEDAGGLSGVFDFGPDDGVSDEAGTTGWFLTIPSAHRTGISVAVYNRPPTVFALLIDGLLVPWTQAQIIPEVISVDDDGLPLEIIHHFNGSWTDGILDAGTHFITLSPDFSNTDGSTGHIRFHPAIAVPEPAVLACMASAAIGWIASRRRQRFPVARRE